MNIIKCPACGKETDAETDCARCGCELSILVRICQAAEQEFFFGKECLEQGEIPLALRHAGKAWRLKKSPAAARLAFVTALALGDFSQAHRWYARISESIRTSD